ncbi:hypothetical protein BGX24_008141 [Mortierella sp. AD032]|nr:hypothetical protein BGX24_008141 [Mortierella sp. AD032]
MSSWKYKYLKLKSDNWGPKRAVARTPPYNNASSSDSEADNDASASDSDADYDQDMSPTVEDYTNQEIQRYDDETIELNKRLKQDDQADVDSSSSSGKSKSYQPSDRIYPDDISHQIYNRRDMAGHFKHPLVKATEQPQVSVLLEDFPSLCDIDIKLRHILQKQDTVRAEDTYIFQTNFFEKLTDGKPSSTIRYDAVKTLENKEDLFSKKYLILPIQHKNPMNWSLAIISNPGLLLGNGEGTGEQQVLQEASPTTTTVTTTVVTTTPTATITTTITTTTVSTVPTTVTTQVNGCGSLEQDVRTDDINARPYIVILDSTSGATNPRTIEALRSYLEHELKEVKHITRTLDADTVVGKDAKFHTLRPDDKLDCGLYLLRFVEFFLKNPHKALAKIVTGGIYEEGDV